MKLLAGKFRWRGYTPSRVFFAKSAGAHENTGVNTWTLAEERRKSGEVLGNAGVIFAMQNKECANF